MPRVYVDTNVWCRVFDRPSKRVIEETDAFFKILEESYEGRMEIVGSVVLDMEVGKIERLEKRVVVERLIAVFVSERVHKIRRSEIEEIKKLTGLKFADAAHLACAIEAGCEYFITCDDEVVGKAGEMERLYGLKVYNPVDFIRVWGKGW